MAARVSPYPLASVRVLLGIAAIIKCIILIAAVREVLAPGYLRFPWFEGFPSLSLDVAYVVLAVGGTAAITLVIGWYSRASAAVLAACVAAVMASDRLLYSNHLYLLLLLVVLVALSDAGAVLSLDARRRGNAPADIPAWPLYLMRLQISVVYGYAALAKLNRSFFSGEVIGGSLIGTAPGRWLIDVFGVRGVMLLASATVVIELYLAVALWSARRWLPAVILGVALHTGIVVFMNPRDQLVVFSLLMFAGYAAFTPAGRAARAP